MAPRKNTQGPGDAAKAAEGLSTADRPLAPDQPTGEGAPGALAATGADTTTLEATAAPQSDAPVPALDANSAGGPPAAERRFATVASTIDHDGEVYGPDDVMLLTEAEFGGLAKTGALLEASWDELEPAGAE